MEQQQQEQQHHVFPQMCGSLMQELIVPHDHDVLFGRGGKNSRHVGNQRLRDLAWQVTVRYQRCSKKGKSDLSRQLVSTIRSLNPPGRFLKRITRTVDWEDVGDEMAREKTSQVLRDAVTAASCSGNQSPCSSFQSTTAAGLPSPLGDTKRKICTETFAFAAVNTELSYTSGYRRNDTTTTTTATTTTTTTTPSISSAAALHHELTPLPFSKSLANAVFSSDCHSNGATKASYFLSYPARSEGISCGSSSSEVIVVQPLFPPHGQHASGTWGHKNSNKRHRLLTHQQPTTSSSIPVWYETLEAQGQGQEQQFLYPSNFYPIQQCCTPLPYNAPPTDTVRYGSSSLQCGVHISDPSGEELTTMTTVTNNHVNEFEYDLFHGELMESDDEDDEWISM